MTASSAPHASLNSTPLGPEIGRVGAAAPSVAAATCGGVVFGVVVLVVLFAAGVVLMA